MSNLNRTFSALLLVMLLVFGVMPVSAQVESIPINALPPNSRLAIWGDSITEITLYPRFVEAYLLACAGRKDVVPPASSLPKGLTYDTVTGVLSGIPATAGVFPIQVAAINAAGVTTKLVTLTVSGQ